MKFRAIKYALVYLTPLVVLSSMYFGYIWSYAAVVFIFLLVPFLELFLKGSTKNLGMLEEEIAKKDPLYDLLLFGLVPMQYAIMGYFLYKISNESLPLYEKIGITSAYGMACGVLGINAAHELGHRVSWYEQLMSKMLLLTTLYMHFFIEHNRGHHKNVSTDEDPASSRYGENIYAFYIRTIRDSWLSAWQLEAKKLKKNHHKIWSLKNEMLQFQLIQIGLLILIAIVYGLQTLLFFIVGAIIGCLLLETVNYIEHYGLRRKKKGDGYERTLPIHSWNSNHTLGRLLLLELSRHSDHHYIASRKYQLLRHFDESPQMPTGYPGMMLLSLVPPIWFSVMHQQIEKYRQTQEGDALA